MDVTSWSSWYKKDVPPVVGANFFGWNQLYANKIQQAYVDIGKIYDWKSHKRV